jgi:hypothetical protein
VWTSSATEVWTTQVVDLDETGPDSKFSTAVARYMYPFFLESTISKTRDEQLALPVEPPADLSTLDARLLHNRQDSQKDLFRWRSTCTCTVGKAVL